MSRVRTVFESDDTQTQATLLRMQQQMTKLIEKNRELDKQSKESAKQAKVAAKESADAARAEMKAKQEAAEAAEKANQQVGDSIENVIAWGASFASVGKAIQLVNAGLERQRELEGKATETRVDEAGAQIKALRNAGQITDAQQQTIVKSVDDTSRETGASRKDLYLALAESLSAKGDAQIEDVLAANKLAARTAPEDQAEMAATAGGLMDLRALTGGTPEENLGFMLATGSQARITSQASIAKNLVPAAIGVNASGGTPAEAAALVSTMTSLAKDREGAASGTAAVQLAGQLAEFLPEQTYTTKGGDVVEGSGLSSTMERIQKLQSDPALREKFLQGASFEAKFEPFIKQLLDPEHAASAQLAANAAAIPGGDAAAEVAREKLRQIAGESVQQTAATDRNIAGIGARYEGDNQLGSQRDQLRQVYEKGLDVSETGAMQSWGNRRWMDAADLMMDDSQRGEFVQGTLEQTIARKKSEAAEPGADTAKIDKQLDALQQLVEETKKLREQLTGRPAVSNTHR